MILRGGRRGRHGTAAIVMADTLEALGGDGVTVEYREAAWHHILRYRRGALAAFAVALLSLFGTMLLLVLALADRASGSTQTLAYRWGTGLFLLGAVLAALKFWQELRRLRES